MIPFVPHRLLTPYIGRDYYFHHKYDMFRDNMTYLLQGLLKVFDHVSYQDNGFMVYIYIIHNNFGMKYGIAKVELEDLLDLDWVANDIIRKFNQGHNEE